MLFWVMGRRLTCLVWKELLPFYHVEEFEHFYKQPKAKGQKPPQTSGVCGQVPHEYIMNSIPESPVMGHDSF